MTKEELKGSKIWFGEDLELCARIEHKLNIAGLNRFGGDYGNQRYITIYNDGDYQQSCGSKESFRSEPRKEITPSQLLGETEEYKAGDWVVITTWQGGSNEGSVVKLIQADHYLTYKNNKGTSLAASPECVRPALPEEIPQEEVEYVECLETSVGSYTKGRVYKLREKNISSWGSYLTELDDSGSTTNGWGEKFFKPSTREAYEAQQKRKEIYDSVENYKKVNKCSTINTNQNECKNEKGSQTKSPLDGNTGAKTGQSIRPRTPSVRVVCESGLLPSGKEVTRTIKSSPRIKAEIGRRFI